MTSDMKMLIPNTTLPRKEADTYSVFYPAGPIWGGDDWQARAAERISEAVPRALVVTPCRYTPEHRLYLHVLKGNVETYKFQSDWEDFYMKSAAQNAKRGCLFFWLPRESEKNPRPRDKGPYAQDTYGELGYWRRVLEAEMHEPDPRFKSRVVFGAQDGFPGLDTFERNLQRAAPRGYPIYRTFEATIAAAIAMAKGIS